MNFSTACSAAASIRFTMMGVASTPIFPLPTCGAVSRVPTTISDVPLRPGFRLSDSSISLLGDSAPSTRYRANKSATPPVPTAIARVRNRGGRAPVYMQLTHGAVYHCRTTGQEIPMPTQPRLAALVLAAGFAFCAVSAVAVDTPMEPVPSAELAAGRKAIEARDWSSAIQSLSSAAQREPRNADVQNLLGFAYRNSGQLETALKHYQRALQLDPRHLGAHEYIGEAYLMANDPAKAEEHLAQLKRYCPTAACEQYEDLRKKIETYRARK